MGPDSAETPYTPDSGSNESEYSPSMEKKSNKKSLKKCLEKKSKKIKKFKKPSARELKKLNPTLTRKIVKNFGKAIAAFAASGMSKDAVLEFVNNDLLKYKMF